MIRSYNRGHTTIVNYDGSEVTEVYEDTLIPVNRTRPCKRCGEPPTEEGYDACFGYIKGLKSACCGHGVTNRIYISE